MLRARLPEPCMNLPCTFLQASLVLRVPTRLPAGADPTRLAPALVAEPASALEATLTHARV